MLFDFERKIGYLPTQTKYQAFSANTAISTHSNHTWALVEADFPFEVKVDKQEKFDIKSVGYDNFNGKLTHHVSAHPKVDRKTGHFMAFAYSREEPVVHYTLFDKERKLVTTMKIPIASRRMLHDFAATQNYVIIPDLPMEADAKKNTIDGKRFIYQLNKDKPARYGILKRFSTNPDETQWFELPCHYCFHYGNAWEEKNEIGEDLIILWGCRADDIDVEFRGEHPFLASNWNTKTTRFEFNLKTGTAK